MKLHVVRSAALSLVVFGAVACGGTEEAGEEKLDDLSVGISQDSLFKVLGTGPVSGTGADSARVVNGYRVSRYFASGKQYMVLYVRELPGDVKELVEQKRETPIVLDENKKVLGWGWKYYAEVAIPQLGLPTPLIDTTTVIDTTKKAGVLPTAAPAPALGATADSAKR